MRVGCKLFSSVQVSMKQRLFVSLRHHHDVAQFQISPVSAFG